MVTQIRSAGRFGNNVPFHHPRYVGTALALFLLAGCSTLELFDTQRQSDTRDETAATFDPETGAQNAPGTTGEASPRAKPTPPSAKPASAAAKAPTPQLDSDSIVGLNEVDAERLFGAPHFVIRQQPATRWHYVSRTCTLDLFFFEDLETRVRRVLAYDVGTAAPNSSANADKNAKTKDRGLKACATSIQAERNDSTG